MSRRSLRLPWDALTVAVIAAVISAAFALHVLWFAPNYDVDWLLIAARRMLAGGSYLSDFDEVTPGGNGESPPLFVVDPTVTVMSTTPGLSRV